MHSPKKGELILFPKTIKVYQEELKELLKREAYGEAMRLLRFLLGLKTEDGRVREEWRMLLEWLSREFPEAVPEAEDRDEAKGEEELLALSAAAKAARDNRYIAKLLQLLNPGTAVDRQLAALDQLAHIPDERAAEELLRRLHDTPLHPFVSFKLLQTLARIGVKGEVTFARLGEIVTVEIERTPPGPDQFPEPLPWVGERVAQAAEADNPMITMFAQKTWEEFLMYIYGTSTYRELLQTADDASLDVWACALHAAVAAAVNGDDSADALLEKYMITDSLRAAFTKAYGAIASFFRSASGVLI